jgi:peptidoglycan/xylan/chitin deacetylase (PgdA/CDA1 family)
VLRHADALPEFFKTDVSRLWTVPNRTRIRVTEELFKAFPVVEREVMTAADIRELSEIPQVTFGSHSVTHAILPTCTQEELRYEVEESKRDLELWTGRPVRVFSYPNGDFDWRAELALAEAGYSLAFTSVARPITLTAECYQVPRSSIMDDGSVIENICHAFGLWSSLIEVLKRSRPSHEPRCEAPIGAGVSNSAMTLRHEFSSCEEKK